MRHRLWTLAILCLLGVPALARAQLTAPVPVALSAADYTALDEIRTNTAAVDAAVAPLAGAATATGAIIAGGTYNSTPIVLTNTQQAGLQLTASGALLVSGGAGGTSQADDTAVTDLTAGGALYDVTPAAMTDGRVGLFRMSADRHLYTVFPTAQNVISNDLDLATEVTAAAIQTAIEAMAADIAEITTNLGVDATHDDVAIATGPLIQANFDDTSPDAVDEGDAGRLRISANRNLYNTIRDAAGNERGANVDASNQLAVADAAVAAAIAGLEPVGIAESATWSDGSGVSVIGGRVTTNASAGTAVIAGDVASLNFNTSGMARVASTPYSSAGVEITSSDKTEDAVVAGAEAGPFILTRRIDAAASTAGASADYAGLNTDSLGLLWSRTLDPCSGVAKSYIPIDITTGTTTELTPALAGASNHYYICAINIMTTAANNVALVDDDTDNCASVTSGITGGLTAAEGWPFAANGGMTLGNGVGSVMRTNGTNRVLCLVTSAATELHGHIVVAAAP